MAERLHAVAAFIPSKERLSSLCPFCGAKALRSVTTGSRGQAGDLDPTDEQDRTMTTHTLAQAHLAVLRADFHDHAGRSLALPIAGAIVWSAIGIAALIMPPAIATVLLLFGTGAIFPLGLAVAHQLGERLIDNPSPLAGLMGRCVLMVNLLWAVHLTVFALAPSYLPLTVGIGLGLHWIVFGWIIGHPVGLIHATTRTALVTAAWWLIPTHRISAVAAAVVATYGYALYALATRPRMANRSHDPVELHV